VFTLLAAALLSACSSATALQPPPPVFSTATPGQRPSPTPPATLEPSATPFAPPLTRLTDPGCCAQPFWSADSSLVLFLDKPEPTAKTAIYGAPITGGAPQIVSERVGIPSPDGRYLAFQDENRQTAIHDVASGEEWALDNKSLRPFFSPTSQRLAWAETIEESSSDFSRRTTIVSVSNLDGGDAHEAITIYGGGIAGWLDDNRLLLAGRLQQDDPDVLIFAFNVTDNTIANIVSENRIRNVSIGPGGQWLLYSVTLDPTNSAIDGLWIVKSDGSQRFKVEVVGSARWRDATHLLIIPFDSGAPSHRLWQFDTETGSATSITNPDVTPFRVAQADWSVSRDGKYVVFVNEQDQALWLITLPPP
jgi:dipeptidyl aminopeptidase/acylaminoacyl peptidase